MKNLSLLTALMFSSSVVYAAGDWTYHKFNSNTEAYTPAPKYSCLEMWCENDCVENTKTGEGECCPEPVEGENCLTGQYNEKGCLTHKPKQCPQGESCQPDGQCATNMCPEGRIPVQDACCLTRRVYLDIDGQNKCCDRDLVYLLDGTKVCQSDEQVCNPLHITTTHIKTTPQISVKYYSNDGKAESSRFKKETFSVYKIVYSGTITPLKDLDLDISILGMIDTSLGIWGVSDITPKFIIKEIKPNGGSEFIKNYVGFSNFPQQKIVNYKVGDDTYTTTLRKTYEVLGSDSKVTLKKGKTYSLDINIRNVCQSCMVDSQCAI